MKLNRLLTWIFSLALCSILASCGSDSGTTVGGVDSGNSEQSTRIHMLASKSGSLTSAQTGGSSDSSLILTLENLEPSVVWYTDRPAREAGTTPLKEYANAVWRDAYGTTNPNATVQFQQAGSPDLEALYLSLSEPSYDEKSNSMRFHARILNDTLDETIPASLAFTNVTLNVLNNSTDDKQVSTYIQYASQANLQPTAVPNQFKVVLSDAGPDMLWVDNAPGTYSDSRPMSYFFPQWPYVFGDNPPNAALFGTTAAGNLQLYLLTLTDPVYDESSGQASYTGTLLGQTSGAMETLHQVILSIDSGMFSRFPLPGKGTGYQGFGDGYNPSTANNSWLYFGSDSARKQMGALWGTQSYLSTSCQPNCRNDLQTMKDKGINLIRLYDWDQRNDHSQFLDYANSLNLKVVVPISNWLPQNPQYWDEQVPLYFGARNFGNSSGTDWHPAIAGVIISNELDQIDGGKDYNNVIGLVARFIEEADKRKFSKSVPVGVPVTFAALGAPLGPNGKNLPSWNQFDRLLNDPRTSKYKDRLMLCPNAYNSKEYLFINAEGTGQGWVQLTHEKFGVPILFTELGKSRADKNYSDQFVKDQLQSVLEYQKAHPEQVLGAMHFQFDNKVWKQTPNDSDSEGAFGMYRHGAIVTQIPTVQADYDYYPGDPVQPNNFGTLTIDKLEPTSTYNAVVEAYK